MRYVISDIHGEYDLFLKLLNKINFSSSDEMIVCGDIIDKGLNSIKLLKYIMTKDNIRCIIGNHEYYFLKYYLSLMQNSPEDFDFVLKKLMEHFPYDTDLLNWDVMDYLESLPYFIEEKDFICVHAGVELNLDKSIVPLGKTRKELLVSDRRFKEPSVIVQTDKCVFFGHTPTSYIVKEQGKILKYKKQNASGTSIKDYYKIHLDLGVWLHGVLGCFCIDNCTEYYVEK